MSTNFREGLAAAKSAIAREAHDEAFGILRNLVSPEDDFVTQARVAKLCSAIDIVLPMRADKTSIHHPPMVSRA